MTDWLLVAAMALVTFSIRYVLLAFSGRIRLSPTLVRALGYVPPVVLTAIVVPAVVLPAGDLWLGWQNARLVGAIASMVLALWRKNLLLTIAGGMAVFWGWQWLMAWLVAQPFLG
ncbi:AzlD domain-containing protein [Nodosilinea sp. LEGE 06152]|uniref:AzlD domain-containing protein n=1 Tax=Nodosilinea sp. LEGE 06152 TaxID=2777966 RepID=UPI001882A699|nr:AzlD domain-containing protein [Nodosilinea sp. LEGE 06152]MBE9160383.1 AzlD domain-containing protein [Nodosilinea sp. LEGE 06152]